MESFLRPNKRISFSESFIRPKAGLSFKGFIDKRTDGKKNRIYGNIANQAIALNSTNASGLSLAIARDGNINTYCGYSTNENDWSIGYDLQVLFTMNKLRFYSLASSERVKNFLIEYWNGSSWAKTSITSWSDGSTQYNSDEAQATNADGWNTVIFNTVSGTKIRVRFTSSWNIGDPNAGISELEVYGN